MNILFITIAFPDGSHQSNIYSDLMEELQDFGHNVYVITSLERAKGGKSFISIENGITIVRAKTLNLKKCNFFEKTMGIFLLKYQYARAWKKFLSKIEFDLIIYSTPPITIESLVRKIKKECQAPTYLLLKDIFPQNAVDLGMISENGLIYNYFRRQEKRLYGVSDFIGCMSQANVDYILKNNKEVNEKTIEVCPNSIRPSNRDLSLGNIEKIRKIYDIPLESTVFIYGGNLGLPQGIDFLISVLGSNKDRTDVFFLIVGSGTEQNRLRLAVDKLRGKNCAMFSFMKKNDYLALLSASDVGLIFLNHKFTIPNFPSRILDYLNAGLPVLAATDKNTDMGEIITRNNFGYWCESNDVNFFNNFANELSLNKDLRKKMGDNARNFLINNYTTKKSCEIILSHFSKSEEAS